MKPKPTLRELFDGWLSFDGRWFWEPQSGFFGSLIWVIVAIAMLLAWGMWS
jgi:hypothetical protein